MYNHASRSFYPLKRARGVAYTAALALGLCFPLGAAAETALIIKGGSFTLSDDGQIIAGGLAVLDEKSSSAFGGELEWRWPSGLALGVEVLLYEHEITNAGGEMQTTVLTGNAKKYFSPTDAIHPYVGAGIGSAGVELSGGAFSGNGSGLALQLIAGIEFRMQNVGLYTEAKYLSAKTEDDENNEADASGAGVFVGLSILF